MSRLVVRFVTVICLWGSILNAQNLNQLSFIPSDGVAFAVKAQGNHLYFVDWRGSSSLFISVDMSNPNQPVVEDSLLMAGFAVEFDLNGQYAYLAMADNEFGLRILDISAPAAIKEIVFIEMGEIFGTFFKDDTLYVTSGGVGAFDASQPDTLKFLWSYNSNATGDGIDVFVFEGHSYLSVDRGGLFIIDNATHDLVGTLAAPEIIEVFVVNENLLFFTDATSGLVAVDIRDPHHPSLLDTITGSGAFAFGVEAAGNFVYFCNGPNGLKTVDFSQPTDLNLKDTFAPEGIFAIHLALKDSLIFLASGDYDETGNFINGIYILKNDFVTAIREPGPPAPQSFVLEQNHPNPFNPETLIRYSLPFGGDVRLEIYNLLGQKIRTLFNTNRPKGSYTERWNGKDDSGRSAAAGLYIYKMTFRDHLQARKMLLVR
ncbi:MAG TPA: FlgD immunoglobulin-like domain containing protein [bacterium]